MVVFRGLAGADVNSMSGGERLMEALRKIDAKLASAGNQPEVRIGFLEGSTYPDGKSLPANAALQEFGGTVQIPAGTVTVYRKVAPDGSHFLRDGRFVKRREANFSSTHATPARSVTIPPRPFFRDMIKARGKTWGKEIAVRLKVNDFDVGKTLGQMGALVQGQLMQSITDTNTPPNAPMTIARKGFNDPLIDTGFMRSRVDYEVST